MHPSSLPLHSPLRGNLRAVCRVWRPGAPVLLGRAKLADSELQCYHTKLTGVQKLTVWGVGLNSFLPYFSSSAPLAVPLPLSGH